MGRLTLGHGQGITPTEQYQSGPHRDGCNPQTPGFIGPFDFVRKYLFIKEMRFLLSIFYFSVIEGVDTVTNGGKVCGP